MQPNNSIFRRFNALSGKQKTTDIIEIQWFLFFAVLSSGERGIRTPGTVFDSSTDFESVPIDHSGISPGQRYMFYLNRA